HGSVTGSSRADTLHDELRLFVSACSRARDQLLVVARDDDDEFPSLFYQLVQEFEVEGLANTNLTLRGHVASLRRALLQDPEKRDLAGELSGLARHDAPGADPDEWYGARAA